VNTTKLKLISATAGAAGVLAMGALSVSFGSSSVAEPITPGPVPTPTATTGETVIESPAAPEATEATVESAVPSITGAAPLPPEEQGLPG
jgi:hypothetical protein